MTTIDRFKDENPNFWISPKDDLPEDNTVVEVLTTENEEKLTQFFRPTLHTDSKTKKKYVTPAFFAAIDPIDMEKNLSVKFWRKIL